MEPLGKGEPSVSNFLSLKNFIKKKSKNLKNLDTWSTRTLLSQNLSEKNARKKRKKKLNWLNRRLHKLLLRQKNKNRETKKP